MDYRATGMPYLAVPGQFAGSPSDTHKRAILYIHGGAFILPASPVVLLCLLCLLCRVLVAVGFGVDYRLSPSSMFPAALNDCERAYRALLDLGFAANRIAIIGESAGGNLTL